MKKTFKDFLKEDIDNVFVNQKEFAETVIINGEEMEIVRDNDFVHPPDTKMKMGNVSKQLAIYDVVFHIKSSYFEYIPQADMLMEFEEEEYRIKRVDDYMGMLTICLSRVDS